MDKKIDKTYAVIALVEILYEEKLINEPTLKAIILISGVAVIFLLETKRKYGRLSYSDDRLFILSKKICERG